MLAEQLFQELGYRKTHIENIVLYQKEFCYRIEDSVGFDLEEKRITFGGIRRNWWNVDFDLLNAIKTQIQELKWFE